MILINPNKMYAKIKGAFEKDDKLVIINGYKFSGDVLTLYLLNDEEVTIYADKVELLFNIDTKEQIRLLLDKYKNELKTVEDDLNDDDYLHGFDNGEKYTLKLIIEDLKKIN